MSRSEVHKVMMLLTRDMSRAATSISRRLGISQYVAAAKPALARLIARIVNLAGFPAKIAGLMLLLSVVYLLIATPQYSAVMTIAPRESLAEDSLKSSLGTALLGIGNLANMNPAFVQLTSAFYSFETARVLVEDPNIATEAFSTKQLDNGEFRYQPSITRIVKASVLGLFGVKLPQSPTTDDMHRYIAQNVHLMTDPVDGTAEISFEHRDPEFAADFLQRLFQVSDSRLRTRHMTSYGENIRFLQKQLDQTASTARRNALIELLVEEDRKRFLISGDMSFAADIIDPVHVSAHPTSPKYLLVLALSAVVGLIGGFILQILRKNEKS